MPWTKEQHAIYTKEWKERNKEKVAAYNKKYRENNLEKFYAYHKKWKEQNKEHLAAYAKEYQEKNKEQLADYKKEWNIKQYGLSLEDYNNMLDKQNHKCKICLTSFTTLNTKDIHIDHCHTTNKVRGILCRLCNTGLGQFKDNTERLTQAINYLQENG
tara:strand:- start:2 stop:475 length:474 start_codon:yes stop_codon:yes gene_type:complete